MWNNEKINIYGKERFNPLTEKELTSTDSVHVCLPPMVVRSSLVVALKAALV